MKYKVPFIKPLFPEAEDVAEDYRKIIDNNWFTNFGPFEKELCQKAAEYLGKGVYIAAQSNATLSLFIAVRKLYKNNADKNQVIMPAFTFAAGAEALIWSNYQPVFIDIDSQDWQPDIVQAENYINRHQDKVAGILLCNIFGVGNVSIAEWEELAKRHSLPLVIDSAAGFGSLYFNDEKIGARGDCEIFSLHATKPFATGEGGFIASKNQELINDLKSLSNFGFGPDKNILDIGMNAKLAELNASIALRQLKHFDLRLAQRREYLKYYKDNLKSCNFAYHENADLSSVAFASILAPNASIADHLYEKLHEASIEVLRYYQPLHYQKVLMAYCSIADSLKTTEEIASRILSVPVHDKMADEDLELIVDALKTAA
jgi:dTDP-4-amino-4,6-dideoxygalactose transaminase